MLPSTYLSPESQGNPDTTSNQPSSPLSSLGSSPSSPTQREMEASRTDIASSEAMPPPAKPDAASKSANASSKRSHDRMNERAERASSRQDDAESDTTKGSTRGKNRANSTDTVNTVTNVSQDEGPSLRETDMNTEGLSQQPPQSAQAPGTPQPKQKAKSQPKKSKSKKTPKPVQDQPVTEDEAENDIDSSVDDEDASELPDQPIEGFDWEGLIYEYHKKTTALEQRESEIMGGCRQLMDFFEAWAVVGSRKETARSFKRLKTQMAYVEREEYDLDQKRLHYIQVVNAFKTVGVLLNKPDWHQSIVPTRRRISRLSTSLDQQASGITTRSRDPSAPVLQFWESVPSIADDIDMKKYHIMDFHASRCVVL